MKLSPINPSEATPQDIIAMGHSFNNAIVNLNHPYSDYGFLRNQESVKGGTEKGWDGFDLLEIQSTLAWKSSVLRSGRTLTFST